ncbi:MAG: DNA repair protein RecN [Anaerolineales bacterium]|nr:DNA repair protein RecN [Anaerolineales bacterium]
MLVELRIDNFAIIEHLNLNFLPGLITFSGETGAGKSIIIDAVEVLVGGRAESTMIRSGVKRAQIEAVFHISQSVHEDIHQILKREDLLDDPDYLTISREIRTTGRNVARVNGRIVNVALLRELGEFLVDVHGQSEHLSLLRIHEHLGLLDRYGGFDNLLKPYQSTYHRLITATNELSDLQKVEREAARRADMLSYQINEIESARLDPGEEEDLRTERTRLANTEAIASLVNAALLDLDEGTSESPSSVDTFGRVLDALNDITRYDPTQVKQAEQTQGIFDEMTELATGLRSYLELVEFNPSRLNQVEERLDLIHNLTRKYGDSIQDVLAYAEQARIELESITQASERIEELEKQVSQEQTTVAKEGIALSKIRYKVAKKLEKELETELADLRMPHSRFKVDFQLRPDPDGILLEDGRTVKFDVNGLERVEFLIAPNPGEGFKPLVKIASGGETSRLMLALKNVLARADQVPTLIFDEIDQGIGGRVGTVVGQKLWQLALLHQVMCITHLPQLAAFGEQHYQVRKLIHDGRTVTSVEDLGSNERIKELALMLGEVSDSSLSSAQEMMDTASQVKEKKLSSS